MKLHSFQKDACRSMWQDMIIDNKRSGLLILPTGGGKTFTAMSFVAALMNQNVIKKVLWVAHRIELLRQANETVQSLDEFDGITTSDWNASNKDNRGNIVFCMVQSSKGLRSLKTRFDLIVIDEAHHNAAADDNGYTNMYQELLKNCKHDYCLGLTATATRLDERALGFEYVYYSCTFLDLVKSGHLASPIYSEMLTTDFYRMAKAGRGDFTQKSLTKLDNPKRNKKIAQEWTDNASKYGQTLLFACNVKHCMNLKREFERQSTGSEIRVVTGNTPKEERDQIRSGLANGCIDVIINCEVFTEGFDAPSVNTVFITRPTTSESLFMQMVGRGARILRDSQGNIIKSTFNLVSVMDDITKFAILVDEIKPLLSEDARVERELDDKRKAKLEDKRNKYNEIAKDSSLPPDLTDAEIRDIEGVLFFASKYEKKQGIPIDQDRGDCLRRMSKYAKECWQDNQFDTDKFVKSYSSCILNGEFPRKIWKAITWAWVTKHVYNKDIVHNVKSQRNYATWAWKPLIEFNQDMTRAAQKRIQSDWEAAKVANHEYNKIYGSESAATILINNIASKAKLSRAIRAVINNTLAARRSIESNNRTVTIKTNLTITGNHDPNIRNIYRTSEVLTEAMQETLKDSCCQVIVKSAGRKS